MGALGKSTTPPPRAAPIDAASAARTRDSLRVVLQSCMQGVCNLGWLLPVWDERITRFNASYAVGACDGVTVEFVFKGAARQGDFNVWYSSVPGWGFARPNLFFSIESPGFEPWQAQLSPMRFDGDIGYEQSSTIWRPYFRPHDLWRLRPNLRFEPTQRRSVGIWVGNCRSQERNEIIRALLNATDYRVESHGGCLRNVDTPAGRGRPPMVPACERHRVMLAVENTVCDGYITEKMTNAMKCGAVPLVLSHGGYPGYDRHLGAFPRIDAGTAGWLQQVRRVMLDDTYYAWFVAQGASPPSTLREVPDLSCQFARKQRSREWNGSHLPRRECLSAKWSSVPARQGGRANHTAPNARNESTFLNRSMRKR